jgi:hypothetical protein
VNVIDYEVTNLAVAKTFGMKHSSRFNAK